MLYLRYIYPAVVLAVLFVAGWEVYVAVSGASPLILPAPSDVANGLWVERFVIARHALATIGVASVGFSLSVLFAFAVSVTLHFVLWLRRGMMPLLVASQTVPIVALAPLMVLWFGFGLLPKVLLVILVTFFPMVVSLMSGYASQPRAFRDQLVSMGARPGGRFFAVPLCPRPARSSFPVCGSRPPTRSSRLSLPNTQARGRGWASTS